MQSNIKSREKRFLYDSHLNHSLKSRNGDLTERTRKEKKKYIFRRYRDYVE